MDYGAFEELKSLARRLNDGRGVSRYAPTTTVES